MCCKEGYVVLKIRVYPGSTVCSALNYKLYHENDILLLPSYIPK